MSSELLWEQIGSFQNMPFYPSLKYLNNIFLPHLFDELCCIQLSKQNDRRTDHVRPGTNIETIDCLNCCLLDFRMFDGKKHTQLPLHPYSQSYARVHLGAGGYFLPVSQEGGSGSITTRLQPSSPSSPRWNSSLMNPSIPSHTHSPDMCVACNPITNVLCEHSVWSRLLGGG